MIRPKPIVALMGFLLCFATPGGRSQTPVVVGPISGGDFRVRGQVEFASDGSALLMSGAEMEVRSGSARLALPGGEARFCGSLKVVVLKNAAGSSEPGSGKQTPLLFALERGTLELDSSGGAAHTVQTPFFSVSATPLAEAPAHKLAVRVTQNGDTCVAALAGSLRVREQLGASELLVPPGKSLLIPAAGVEKAAPVVSTACGCVAATLVPKPLEAPSAPSAGAAPEEKGEVETKTTIAPPPLIYRADPGAAAPPDSPAATEPAVTLPVVVAPAPGPAQTDEAPRTSAPAAAAPPARTPSRSGFATRLKNFFRALFGARPKASRQ